jgi:exopolyphosphatase/guanosine-5'-triphosphate,3'-diphosphate pyrophosphatase
LSLLLALAESLDYSESDTIKTILPGLDPQRATLEIQSASDPSIELHQLEINRTWFEEEFGIPLKIIVRLQS